MAERAFEPYRADHRGRFFNFLWPFTRYLISNLTAAVGWPFFFLLSRTRVIGRRNIPKAPNTLLVANHQSMIDSFLVGFAGFFGPSWIHPYLIPWNPAAEENFYKTRFGSWWADQWKCIPVRPGRRDLKALHRMIGALRGGTMTLFPEGTRSRDGTIGRGRPGAGLLILANRPTVVPVTIDGMDRVLPIGCRIPKVFKRVTVMFGPSVDYSEFLGQERSKETAQQIVDKVMDRIRSQQAEIRRGMGRRNDAERSEGVEKAEEREVG